MHVKLSKLVFTCATICLIGSSCLSSKKLDREVAKQLGGVTDNKKKKAPDGISITSGVATMGEVVSTTETKTSNMLPLLLYWQWRYTNTCTVNPQIPINSFTNTVSSYSGKALKPKLNGQTLELVVEKIPHQFQILDKAHLVFVVYAFGWDNVSIRTTDNEMVVSYRLLKDNAEVKKGRVSIPGGDDKQGLGMFKHWKVATSEYLTQFDENIVVMSKQVVDKLAAEL